MSDPLTYWWGVTLCPPELNDVSLAESVVILMRYAAIKEINLNTEVQKPLLAEVLEFQGPTMECADESTPHQETRIYSSVLEGGNVMQQFEADDSMGFQATGAQHELPYPVRTEGRYVVPVIPWPRDPEKDGERCCRCAEEKAAVKASSEKASHSEKGWQLLKEKGQHTVILVIRILEAKIET